jgi:predicted nucleic acid-binding protein
MEYEAVCTRPEHLAASGLSARQLDLFLDGLASIVQPVEVHFLWRPQLRDPADELVLEAAVNASARALLTFNQKHFVGVANRFLIEVVTPGEFLRSLP